MELLSIIAVIAGVAAVLAIAVLFMLRHSRLCKDATFAKTAWRIIALWCLITISAAFLPLDYWHNPPLKRIIRLPKRAEVLSCYRSSGGKKDAFRNPWGPKQSVFGDAWFNRRGFRRIIGKNLGPNVPALNAIASQQDGNDAICLYKHVDTQRAIIVERSWGGSSGDNFITLRLLEKGDSDWEEVKHEDHRRSGLDDIFSRFSMTLSLGLVFILVIIVALGVCRWLSKTDSVYIAPKRFVFSMTLPFILSIFTAVIITWVIVPSLLAKEFASIPAVFLLLPAGCFLLAYLNYRVVLWREVKCSSGSNSSLSI